MMNFQALDLSSTSHFFLKPSRRWLVDYLDDNDLHGTFQSTYKKNHSVETAILRVQKDNLRVIDNQCASS